MVSDPATVTRSLSLITTSNGISSFSAPSSSDYEGDAVGSDFNQGNKEMRDTYEIIEQVLSFCPFLLPLNSPFETGFFHVVQIVCATGNQHDEPRKPRKVPDENENSAKTFRTIPVRRCKEATSPHP